MIIGTVFGRSPNLALGVLMTAFNVVVLFHVAGFQPTSEQISGVNVFLGALVAFIANIPQLAIAAGVRAIGRMNDAAPGNSTPGTTAANVAINGGDIKVVPK